MHIQRTLKEFIPSSCAAGSWREEKQKENISRVESAHWLTFQRTRLIHFQAPTSSSRGSNVLLCSRWSAGTDVHKTYMQAKYLCI